MVADHIRRYYPEKPERIRVLYNGVDLERFRPAVRDRLRLGMRQRLGVGSDLMILFVANNFRLKGLHCLIRALAKVKPVRGKARHRLCIVGRGRREPYGKLADRLDCSEALTFLGPQQDVEAYYAAADLLVHPTFYDPSANVCLEAMASGLPTITTRFNGVSEVMQDHDLGEWVIDDPDDAASLGERILRLGPEDLRREMGRRARAAVEGLSLESHGRRVLEVYREVLAEKESSHDRQGLR